MVFVDSSKSSNEQPAYLTQVKQFCQSLVTYGSVGTSRINILGFAEAVQPLWAGPIEMRLQRKAACHQAFDKDDIKSQIGIQQGTRLVAPLVFAAAQLRQQAKTTASPNPTLLGVYIHTNEPGNFRQESVAEIAAALNDVLAHPVVVLLSVGDIHLLQSLRTQLSHERLLICAASENCSDQAAEQLLNQEREVANHE